MSLSPLVHPRRLLCCAPAHSEAMESPQMSRRTRPRLMRPSGLMLSALLLLLLLLAPSSASAASLASIPPRLGRTRPLPKGVHGPRLEPLPLRSRPGSIVHSSVSVLRVALEAASSASDAAAHRAGAMLLYEVAIFTLHLSHHFSPRRGLDRLNSGLRRANSSDSAARQGEGEGGGDTLSSDDLWPEEMDSSSLGLVSLVCGGANPAGHIASHRAGEVGGGAKGAKVFESLPAHFLERHEKKGQQGSGTLHDLLRSSRSHSTRRRREPAHDHRSATDSASATRKTKHTKSIDKDEPEAHLIPLDDSSSPPTGAGTDHALFSLLRPLLSSAPEVVAGGSRLRWALVLGRARWVSDDEGEEEDDGNDDESESESNDGRSSVLSEAELDRCHMHFLPSSLQRLSPPGWFIDLEGKVLRGSVRFDPSAGGGDHPAEDAEGVQEVFEAARVLLPPALPAVTTRDGETDDAADDLDLDADSFIDLDSPPGATAFLQSQARVQKFGELAKSLTTAIIKPAAAAVGGALCATYLNQVKLALFQSMQGTLGNEVPNAIVKALVAPTVYELVSKLSKDVNEKFPAMLAKSLVKSVTPRITESITTVITTKCAHSLSRSNAEKIGRPLVEAIIPEILLPLGTVLTKSLAQGLVPAILHTLEATPHMDYYCYFCKTHKVYCGYCTYAPQQLYYANYYASYFSTYYAHYFTRFAVSAFQRQRNPLDYSHRIQTLSMADDESLELVLPADETVSAWKDEERRKGTLHLHKALRPQDRK